MKTTRFSRDSTCCHPAVMAGLCKWVMTGLINEVKNGEKKRGSGNGCTLTWGQQKVHVDPVCSQVCADPGRGFGPDCRRLNFPRSLGVKCISFCCSLIFDWLAPGTGAWWVHFLSFSFPCPSLPLSLFSSPLSVPFLQCSACSQSDWHSLRPPVKQL